MKLKNEKGSITIFVLIGLLFMSAFLIISYASNVNKSKILQEQSNIIEGIYMKNDNSVDGYQEAYSALRKKNKQILTAYVEDSNTIELTNTFEERISNYRIYGNGKNLFDINSVTRFYHYNTPEVDYTEEQANIYDGVITSNVAAGYSTVLCNSNIIELEAGTYTLSVDAVIENSEEGLDICFGFITIDNTKYRKFSTLSSYQTWERKSYTFTLSEKQKILGFVFQGNTKNETGRKFKNIQLEKGSIATEYKPYDYGVGYENTDLFNPNIKLEKNGAYLGTKINKIDRDYTLYIKLKEGKTIPVGAYFGIVGKETKDATTSATWLVNNGILKDDEGKKYAIWHFNPDNYYNIGIYCYEATQTVWDAIVDAFDIKLFYGNYHYNNMPKDELYGQYSIPIRITQGNNRNKVNISNFNIEGKQVYYQNYFPQNPKVLLEANTTYTLAFDYKINSSTSTVYASVGYGTTGYKKDIKTFLYPNQTQGKAKVTFTTPNEFLESTPNLQIRFARMDKIGDFNIDISNVQFQKGTEINDFESSQYIIKITLKAPLKDGDHIDFIQRKVKRSDGTEENIDLPELSTFEDYTKIEILTEVVSSKIEVEYVGYTLE